MASSLISEVCNSSHDRAIVFFELLIPTSSSTCAVIVETAINMFID